MRTPVTKFFLLTLESHPVLTGSNVDPHSQRYQHVNRDLSRLNRQIAELTELLALEQEAAEELREIIILLRDNTVTPAEAGKNFLRNLLADDAKASETIGLSPSINCGKKVVTIPLIIEGKHMMSLTVWKSDIVRI